MPTLLTRDDCRLVQASFAQIEPMSDAVAAMFYRRLFEINPELRKLFKSDLELQGIRFMEKLAVAVQGLQDPDSIVQLVQTLGHRHLGYGVHPADYETAAEALLWALGEAFGTAFNSGLRSAWSAAFRSLASEMLLAAGENPDA